MARFFLSGRYANGNRNGFTNGGRLSIEHTHTRGWTAGVEIECFALEDGTDRFDVYMTPGSSGNGHRVLVGQVIQRKPGKAPVWRPAKGPKRTDR
ncbi:MAG TPA: hypothetical protein VFE08_14465 [Candidatus Sulfotelmatobacter sp.]|jgi:hypothetical protein|nr:hypothetical protein [Candidatus Sulfotelmatobacter sp.]